MLKHLGHRAKRTLLQIFNLSWHSGKFPSKWKEAHIRPILKKGKEKSKPENYRPVSLLSCTGKLLERVINARLLWHLESNHLLTPTQTGYRQHHSTEEQLAFLTQDIEDGFQEKKKTLAVFFDLSKAFDTVWKEGLLLKLLRMKVCGKMYNWLHDFLFQRTARVKLDGTLSNLVKMREGVPQGGVVSPTLFLVYINDIVSSVPRHVSNTLHADDFAVWASETSTGTATHRIQTTINRVSSWTNTWALNINTLKTTATLFSLSTSKEKISLKLDNQQVPQVDTPTFLGVTLDTRLTWKPHIETMEQRTVKKLSLMKKLAGTSWGANAKILRQVYTGAVRPAAEYASSSWMTASKTSKTKLDKVQNSGLRIILGAMKTTPIGELEKTADLQPLESRREYKALAQAEKSKRLPSHPLHDKLQKQTKNRLKRRSLNHIVKDLQEEKSNCIATNCEDLQPTKWTQRRHVPQIRCDVPDLEKKGTQLPTLQRSITLEMIEKRYPSHSWIHAFTDGSADEAVRNAGSGVSIRFPERPSAEISIPVGERSSNYRAEVQALTIATQHLIETDDLPTTNLVFLTDSLSALQALQSGPTDSSSQQLQDNLHLLSERGKVVLQWIPAHVGIAGNEAADRLAKKGSRLPQPNPPTTYKEAKAQLKNHFQTEWRNKNKGYKPEEDHINQLTRREQTIIFRLRTGHCGLRKHLKKIGVTDTAACQCGAEEQTPHHFLQTCPHQEQLRQEVWPSDTSVNTKLWGPVDDLRKTAQFVSSSGLRL
jgi:ribonuclease HI